jgi:hypothetical protein
VLEIPIQDVSEQTMRYQSNSLLSAIDLLRAAHSFVFFVQHLGRRSALSCLGAALGLTALPAALSLNALSSSTLSLIALNLSRAVCGAARIGIAVPIDTGVTNIVRTAGTSFISICRASTIAKSVAVVATATAAHVVASARAITLATAAAAIVAATTDCSVLGVAGWLACQECC